MAVAKLMLDTIHEGLPVPPTDPNTYYLGNIGDHNIAIAILPQGIYGISAATAVATHLLSTFSKIRFSLMVGISGGVPTTLADIRLGDIVVSQPENTSGGVIQYDLLKVLGNGEFKRTGMLNQPPLALLTALGRLRARHYTEKSRVSEFLDNIRVMAPEAADFAQPKEGDVLYQADYVHLDGPSNNCDNCDQSKTVSRPIQKFIEPVIHYGLIASANQLVRDGRYQDRLAQDLGVYCVEMEAAGLMNHFPCLVIRGISDYADSHKNKTWQLYAAGVAAAYAGELLLEVPSNQVNRTSTAREALAPVDTIDTNNLMIEKPPAAKVLYEKKGYGWSRFSPIPRNGSRPWNSLVQVQYASLETWLLHLGHIVTVCALGDTQSEDPEDPKAYAKVSDLRSVGDGRYMVVYTWLYTRDEVLADMETEAGIPEELSENLKQRWPENADYDYMFSTNWTVTLWDTAICLAPDTWLRRYVTARSITRPSEQGSRI